MDTLMTQDEKDEIVVEFMLSQERDSYCHTLNLERYDQMLNGLPEGEWKKRVEHLRAETAKRLNEVDTIIAATEKQMPPKARIEAAMLRSKQKDA